ncbi:hypothetical protein RhiJN_20353 [Ceratobasidium sp. AG-Ba]|nr:hypothetical protein RhiJN_20353 [Ceratobasidium sp. AG-Ba]
MENTNPGLDIFLQRRLCRSLEASNPDLWTLPSDGLPEHVLRAHVDDNSVRALHAFLGSKIFSPAIESAIDQTFDSYPGHVRIVIVSQMTSTAVLSRVASRLPLYAHKVPLALSGPHEVDPYRTQLLYAAISALVEHHGEDDTAQWIKTLVGNVVPVIMDAISDWDDLDADHSESVEMELDEHQPASRSLLVDSELDDSDLADLLEKHLAHLDPLDEHI